jgi:hypothetical protein
MIRSQKSRVTLLVANVVLLGVRAQKALFTPANCYINDFLTLQKSRRLNLKFMAAVNHDNKPRGNITTCCIIMGFFNSLKMHYENVPEKRALH